MDITAIQGSLTGANATTASPGTEPVSLYGTQEANVQDVSAFQNAINRGDEPSISDSVLSKLQSMSASMEAKGEELERLVVKATKSLNPVDVIAANRVMSEYYLENLMTAKLIGNATKAIERLTSLQ